MADNSPPPQFSLRQLMVLIAILSVFLGVTVPCVNALRVSGRGDTCRNNLRNLALAAYQYENRYEFYPGIVEYKEDSAGGGPWMRPMIYNLFQDLERNDLHELYHRDMVPSHTLPNPKPYLELLICPNNAVRTGTPCSYVINAGFWHNGQQWEVAPWAGISYWNHAGTTTNFNNNSKFVDTHDGCATTALFTENLDGSSWTADFSSPQWIGRCFHWGNYPPIWQRNYFQINARNKGSQRHQGANNLVARPSSNHKRSVNMAFCDAHVRTVRDTIDYRVYAQLCTPWGNGQRAGSPHTYNQVNVWQHQLAESDF